jgi:hypothetical protein
MENKKIKEEILKLVLEKLALVDQSADEDEMEGYETLHEMQSELNVKLYALARKLKKKSKKKTT